jgi:DNA-binding MarR family transcriptional regulator
MLAPPSAVESKEVMDVNGLDEIVAAWKRERPDVDMSPLRITMVLRRALDVFERRRHELLSASGLTPSGLDLLSALRRSGPPYRQTPSELAKASLLTAGSISQRLARLEEAGMVARSVDPGDRRVIQVELTDKGLATIDSVLGPYMEQELKMVSSLTDRQRRDLERLLLILVQASS